MININKRKPYIFLAFFISLSYSFFVAWYFSGFYKEPFLDVIDRKNYILHVSASDVWLFSYDFFSISDFFSFVVNEPLWKFLNYALGLFLTPEDSIFLYVFISSFLFCFSVFYLAGERAGKNIFFLVFLVFVIITLPQVAKNYIAHLRQGVAISLFFFTWAFFKERRRGLLLLTPFIHASFFFVILIYFFSYYSRSIRFDKHLKSIIFSLVFSIAGFFALDIADFMGARQIGYELADRRVSGLGFIFWSAVFFIYLSQGKKFIEKNALGFYGLLFYLSAYWFLPVIGRIFESVLVFVLLASLDLSKNKFLIFLILYSFYFIYLWLPKLGEVGFGWVI